MEAQYKFETFTADAASFDQDFSNFLNTNSSQSWKVKTCSYCHDNDFKKMWASCIFKKK